MPEEPQIKAMSKVWRKWFFRSLVLTFLLALPTVIFYTTGYRVSFENDATSIITTGGMYVDTVNTDVEVYLDEERIMRPRLFRSAYYLQNIAVGKHRVVVQAAGLHTWVKELPVDAHIVTEAAAFNVPVTPHLRPITEFQTSAGAAVYFNIATSTIFGDATSTEPFIIATSTATTTYDVDPEYDFVDTLFASSSSSTVSVFADNAPEPLFQFASQSPALIATTSTNTAPIIERGDIRIADRGWEVYANWQGDEQDIPYYFCVTSSSRATTSARYGEHVAEQIFSELASTTATSTVFTRGDRTCRTEIKLNHLQQDVYAYDFFPGTSDQVVLHLAEGLYVTEIDDRAWQNVQPLLLGKNFSFLIENDVIYVKRGEYFFELMTEIDSN